MPIICPTVTAYSKDEYKNQMDKILHLGHRIQIDLTDGEFTKEKTVSPEDAWWPVGFLADLHLMYKNPIDAIHKILEHKPNLIIIHAEAEGSFDEVAELCGRAGVKVGAALLQDTPAETLQPVLDRLDHVLIFSGNLGYQGGSSADLGLLEKAKKLKQLKPDLEIGWDGGVSDQNVAELILGGVDVLNVGGYIQNSDNPEKAYKTLEIIADETGTT
jgi:ribulose-phosphate 3-epimerase